MSKQAECYDFIKHLVEFGGVYTVDDEGFIMDNEDESVLINVSNKGIPLRVYQPNMKAGEYAILNPLVEPLGVFNERVWFFKSRCAIIGSLTKAMMKKLAEAASSTDGDIDYDKLDLVQPYLKSLDKKFIKEIEQIKPVRLIRMHYNKKTRTATMMTDIYDEEFRAQFKGFRKRSWTAIEGLLEMFYGTDDISGIYTYKAKHIGFPESDACIHLMIMVAKAIHEYVETILGDRKINVKELVNHLSHIEEYHDVSAWFTSGNTQKSGEEESTIKTKAPWQTKEITGIVPSNHFQNMRSAAQTYDPTGIVPTGLTDGPSIGPMPTIVPGGGGGHGMGITVPKITGRSAGQVTLRDQSTASTGGAISRPRLKNM